MPPTRPSIVPTGFQSKSTPNLPTIRSFETFDSSGSEASSAANVTPTNAQKEQVSQEPASPRIAHGVSNNDYSLDGSGREGAPSPSPATSDDEGSSEGEEEEEDGAVPNLPPRPLYKHHFSRSHTYLATPAFAPPFYNRTGTPLPPSPSLTSLLRPNFSSANSRPTTPDPSSDEGGGPGPTASTTTAGDATGTQTPNSAAASTLTSTYRIAKPIPRASPKVPTYEYYGFTLYLTSSLAFTFYLLWAFLPKPFLEQLGIYYFPDRWWALAIPAWTVVFILYIYVALASYNTGYLTLPLDSVECLVDEAANIAVIDAHGKIVQRERPSWASVDRSERKTGGGGGSARGKHVLQNRKSSQASLRAAYSAGQLDLDWRSLWDEGTDAVMDIPVGGVCEILYGAGRDDDDEDASDVNA